MRTLVILAAAALALPLAAGCTDQIVTTASAPAAAAPAPEGEPSAEAGADLAPPPPAPDAGPAGPDAPPPPPSASRCATQFGAAVTPEYGRLDGVVHAVVVPTDHDCRSDNDHVLVQIDMQGATYTAWVNVQSTIGPDIAIRFAQVRAPLALGAWSEGWHPQPGQLDLAGTLGLHSDAPFQAMARDQAAAQIASLVKVGARVSVYFDGFNTHDGGHKVHRNSGAADGALAVIEPSGLPRYLVFHFATQSF